MFAVVNTTQLDTVAIGIRIIKVSKLSSQWDAVKYTRAETCGKWSCSSDVSDADSLFETSVD